ncbi:MULTISPECIES: hypothetical protein [Geomonas]|uniref:Uncharacterized protein n=1 Tax=Geomonas diazotrophica TaxID=2843197 RepID=A0ABX8JN56_9BACT|nr:MULTISPECIES: hypothetical protein [Geomonas]QWV98812.1 hypothetical protein KP005_05875 [Geomonas nitrogeniifigens]
MAKKVMVGAACFTLAIVIFCGGIWVGMKLPSFMFGVTPVIDAYAELLPTWMAIKEADRNDYEALKRTLNISLDGQILKLHYRLQEAKSGNDVDKAKNLLRSVAEHRTKIPPVYGNFSSSKEMEKAISDILAKYR